MRVRQLVGGAFIVILVALIGHNLYWMHRNQSEISCGYTPCVQPRDIGRVAEANAHPIVSGRIANYQYLRERIGGATVQVPAWMDQDQVWHLERVARLDVVVSETPLEVAPERVRALRKMISRPPRRWLRERKGGKRGIWKPFYVQLDRAASRYVLAETPDLRGPLFLLPERLYGKVAAVRR